MSLPNDDHAPIDIADFDIDQLLQLPSATPAPEPNALDCALREEDVNLPYTCSAHPGDPNCICHGLMGDWDVPAPTIDQALGLPEPDYSRFQDYIPGFYQPEKPCDYCRSKNLNCYMRSGESSCKPCHSLFRECSLTNSNTLEASNYVSNSTGAFLDTLHTLDEDQCRDKGTFTGVKPLNSKTRRSGTSTPANLDDDPGSSKRNGIRFPRYAVKILREWLDANQSHPYPTEEEKAELERQTELKPSQIANWLANARRRAKAIKQSRPRLCMSPSLRPSTAAIAIPEPQKPWEELNPLERWENSPPENEPAALENIVNAVETTQFPEEVGTPSSYETRRHKGSSNGSGISRSQPASTTSFETSHGSSASSAARSHGSSHGSFGSFSSSLAGKKDRRRRRRNGPAAAKNPMDDKKRIFQCTFCTDTFKSKYDWTRHEKSLHLSLEKWICAPLGPYITDTASGQLTCVYCGLQHEADKMPKDHDDVHNHRTCEEKGVDARTFYRKDHLRQHLRLLHNCQMAPSMEAWKFTAVHINSRCGFCAQRFTVWQERVDHLTAHFKAGARMSSWKGCRGLDPAVAAQVTNAMPPYLIGIEAASPNPFSATNRSMEQYSDPKMQAHIGQTQVDLTTMAPPNTSCGVDEHPADSGNGGKATCWEILTVRLGKYANEMATSNTVVTDEMLQSQARQILYGSDDAWNQTAADNPEWLDLFKKSHGLDFIPSAIGGQGTMIPEDLETYGDLGLRVPFAVQLQAYNQTQIENQQSMFTMPSPYQHAAVKRREQVQSLYHSLAKEGVLHRDDYRCQHTECEKNVVDTRAFEHTTCSKPKQRRWCSYELPLNKAQRLATLTSPAQNSSNPNLNSASLNNLTQHHANCRRQGLQALEALDHTDSDCCWKAHDAKIAAARSRAERLSTVKHGEIDNCLYQMESTRLGALNDDRRDEAERSRARANGLQTLINLETAEVSDNYGPNGVPPIEKPFRYTYLPRHKYELPPDRARRFATLTGKWEDSGSMPAARRTTPEEGSKDGTIQTGAIMEFLGGSMGAQLDFANDTTTSSIPLARTQPEQPRAPEPDTGTGKQQTVVHIDEPTAHLHQQQQRQAQSEQARVERQEGSSYAPIGVDGHGNTAGDPHDWFAGTDHWVDESVLMQDLDELIASGGPQVEFGGMDGVADESQWAQNAQFGDSAMDFADAAFATTGEDLAGIPAMDLAMPDAEVEDLNFDSVFDFDALTDDFGHGRG